MKKVKQVNGYTIYKAATTRDADNYNCHVGSYNIYLSSDIRDFGLTNSYPEWEDEDSLAVAIARCKGSNYAVAVALADELSDSTVQDMDLCLEIERRLDAGESIGHIVECYDRETGRLYATVGEAIAAGYEPYMDTISALDADPYGALEDTAEGFGSGEDTSRYAMRNLRKGDTFVIGGYMHTAGSDAHPSGDASYDGYIVYDIHGDSFFEDDFPADDDDPIDLDEVYEQYGLEFRDDPDAVIDALAAGKLDDVPEKHWTVHQSKYRNAYYYCDCCGCTIGKDQTMHCAESTEGDFMVFCDRCIGKQGFLRPEPAEPQPEPQPEQEHRSHASYYVVESDGTYYTKTVSRTEGLEDYELYKRAFFRAVAERIAFSDCGEDTVEEIVYDGEPCHYTGWQPGMVIEFASDVTGEIVYSGSFPEWDH